jgi:hypothetical protein
MLIATGRAEAVARGKLCPSSSSLAERVVQELKWRENGPPVWVQGKGKLPCRSADEAATLRDVMVKRLRRHGDDEPLAMELADRLASCEPARPCASGACPICGRSHQRWFVEQCRSLLLSLPANTRLYTMSLVPDFGRCKWNKLKEFDVAAIKLKVIRILRSSGVNLAFGGIDFSVNIDCDCTAPYLQAQFYLIFAGNKSFEKETLRIELNKSGKINRPVRITEFDGNNAGFAYALKYEFFRREGYLQPPDLRNDSRSSLNTRNRSIRGRAAVQLAMLLERLGLEARLFLIGVKRIQRNGEVNMTVIK